MMTRPQAPETFAGAMRSLVEAGRELPGNRRFEAYQGTSDPREFVVIEAWDSDEAADAHLGADHTEQTFVAIGPLLEQPSAIVRHVRVA